MTFVPTKGGNLHNIINDNIWSNQKTESFGITCNAHMQFDITSFPTFVEASDIPSSVLAIH